MYQFHDIKILLQNQSRLTWPKQEHEFLMLAIELLAAIF